METVAIELINSWRKSEAEKGAEESMLMRKVCTKVYRVIVTALNFSQSHWVSRGGYFE